MKAFLYPITPTTALKEAGLFRFVKPGEQGGVSPPVFGEPATAPNPEAHASGSPAYQLATSTPAEGRDVKTQTDTSVSPQHTIDGKPSAWVYGGYAAS